MNIVLCGMPCCGKSKTARVLSSITGWRVYDTDTMVEREFGSIKTLFQKFGESGFRMREGVCVDKACEHDGIIISTGGGTLLDEKNALKLKEKGKLVFLDVPVGILIKRAKRSTGRPLLDGDVEANMTKLYEDRRGIYLKYSDVVIDANMLHSYDLAKKILNELGLEKYVPKAE